MVAGLFGFPHIAHRVNSFVFNAACNGFAGAAPDENLKRIIDERRTDVNRWTKKSIVIRPG